MRNVFKNLVGAALAGALLSAVPAQARDGGYRDYREYRGGYERHRYRDYDRPRYRDYGHYKYKKYRGHRHYPRGYYGYRAPPRVYYRDHYYRDDSGAVIAAGVIGLAIGAAIASSRDRDRYYDRYDD
jgi:hypothetical protein